ncbi:MAG: KTSC domain-containing protein [Gemmatimonadetes bacterium]|nr:KTSC domain-containing protein [Gemmatimonadota bacterium]
MVRSVGYDSQTQTLEVEFQSGWVYQYYGVSDDMHDRMMEAPSKGRFLNMHIRDSYPYSRIA